MARASAIHPATDLARRLEAFVVERFPFAVAPVRAAFDACKGAVRADEASLDALRATFEAALRSRLQNLAPTERLETTPGVEAPERFQAAIEELVDACDGFLRRAAIRASLTPDERREILRGMVLTRATDNRLKTFFTGGEVRYGDTAFQGKGFRSLGQEAIYAAGIRLRRGETYPRRTARGAATSSRRSSAISARRSRCGPTAETVRMVLTAQMGKAGPPMDGKDLHIGDFDVGHPARRGAARDRHADDRRAWRWRSRARAAAASPCRSSARAARRSASGTRRSTCAPRASCRRSSASRTTRRRCRRPFASSRRRACSPTRRPATAFPGITIDGTDPDEIAAAFAWAVERARAGRGPALIELVSMRMCGHAHHDDMLYLGKDPQPSWEYPPLARGGLRQSASCTRSGRRAIRSRRTRRGSKPTGSSTTASSIA